MGGALRGLRADQERRQDGRREAGRVDPVDEADTHPGEQQAGDGRTCHQAKLEQCLEHGVGGGQLGPADQVRQDRGHPGLGGGAEAGGRRGQHEQRPQRGAEVGVDRQADAAQGRQELRDQQQPAAVGAVGERSAEQAPGDQRQQLRERGQPDSKRRMRQRIDLIGHRDGGELGSQHGEELPGGKAPQVAGSAQRRQVDNQMPPDPGDLLHSGQANELPGGRSAAVAGHRRCTERTVTLQPALAHHDRDGSRTPVAGAPLDDSSMSSFSGPPGASSVASP